MDSYLKGQSGLDRPVHGDEFYGEHMGEDLMNQSPMYGDGDNERTEEYREGKSEEYKSPSEQSDHFFSVMNYNPSPEEKFGSSRPVGGFSNPKSNSHLTPNENITLNMPGAFSYGDNMEMDDSPTFNPESFFEMEKQGHGMDNSAENGSSTPFTTNTSHLDIPEPFPKVELGYNDVVDEDDVSVGRFRGESIDSYSNRIPSNSFSQMNQQNNGSTTNNTYGDMSPLTTTTSLTPSVNSMHSTQMSFFSAQQYLTRNSLDQTSSQPHFRQSIEFYANKLQGTEGQHKHSNTDYNTGGKYSHFTTSISNYIPFMSDKNHRSPTLNSPIVPQRNGEDPNCNIPPHGNNSRHLIRSIFKSSNIQNHHNYGENENFMYENDDYGPNVNEENEDSDYISQRDDRDFDLMDPSSNRKNKRSKINIFNRFKGPTKPETNEEHDLPKQSDIEEGNESGNLEAYNLDGERIGSNYSFPSTNQLALDSISDGDHISQHMVEGVNEKEPDYAALFEKVGKRRNLVNNSHRKSKAKTKEAQNEANAISSSMEPSSINEDDISLSYSSLNTEEPKTSLSSESVMLEYEQSYNQSPEKGNKSQGTGQSSSAFATASKRILGSKLISKKKPEVELEPIKSPIVTPSKRQEVEVDLESLDLPPTTKVFPSTIVNQKTRTRGRKENKVADLSDSSKIYLCNYCSRRFKRQEHLKRHFRSLHTFEKPYDCSICHKKFSRSDNLNQHLKIHRNEEGISETPEEM